MEYEVTILGYGADAITVYNGANRDEYEKANEKVQRILKMSPHEVAITTRSHMDGEVWYEEANYFLG